MSNNNKELEQHWRKGTRELCKVITDIDYQTGMVDVYYAIGVADIALLIERAYNICASYTGSEPITEPNSYNACFLGSSFDNEEHEDVRHLWDSLLSDSNDIEGLVPT